MESFEFKLVDDDTYCIMSYMGNAPEVTIPAEYHGKPVTVLFDDIFKNHEELTKVNFPDTLNTIGGFAFDCCWNLKKITLPPKLEHMWQYAFVRCGIEEIVLPETVKSIVPFTFQDCINLKRVVCNEGLKRIGGWAFKNCINLEEVVIPAGVEISEDAFAGCSKLKIE